VAALEIGDGITQAGGNLQVQRRAADAVDDALLAVAVFGDEHHAAAEVLAKLLEL
jgi:hypothetical protein